MARENFILLFYPISIHLEEITLFQLSQLLINFFTRIANRYLQQVWLFRDCLNNNLKI